MKTVVLLSLACLAYIAAGETENQTLRRIERILKPTSDDQRSQKYLYKRINKAEKECKEGKCKELRATLTEGTPVENFTTAMKAYDECMDECRVKEQRSFDKLKEIEKKSDFWNNFNEVKKEMSVKDAIVYWTEIRDEFKLLEADQLQMEKIVRILKPSEADKHMRDELYKRVNKAEKVCKEHKCKDIREKLVAGNSSDIFIELMKSYDKCMDECRVKEQSSFDLLGEIDKKPDFWSNFKKVRHGMSREDALIYWTEIQDEFKLLQKEEEKFERIERILKPSEADKNMREELQGKIEKTEKVYNEGKCKAPHEELLAANGTDGFFELLKKYDECMKECRENEKWAFDMLAELEKKSDFWNNMQEVRDGMSTLDAVVYWSEIRDEFKLLEAEEEKYEAAMARLTLTKEEIEQKEKLDAEIRDHDRMCKTQECASFRKAVLQGGATSATIPAANDFFECMRACKSALDDKAQQLDKLQEREDYYKNMQEVREQTSVIAAVQYYEEIKLDIATA